MSNRISVLKSAFYGLSFVLIFTFLITTLGNSRAWAQCSDDDRKEIHKTNKEAMEQYQNMEFQKARELLQKAFKKAESSGCTYDWIHAKTLMNLGILLAGGEGKKGLARKFIIQALRVRPEAPLDKDVATPVLSKIYNWARRRLRIKSEPAPWPEIEIKKEEPPPIEEGAPSVPLEHEPISQAPQGIPLSVTCRISEDVQPKEVLLFYRPFKQEVFKTIQMEKTNKPYTWKALIPGDALWGSTLQYYIRAKPKSDMVVASSGSMISPHIIEIVSEGGLADKENPLKGKSKKKKKPGKKRFLLRFGPAFGVGLARGPVEVMDEQGGVAVRTGEPYDQIEKPGFAPGSLGATVEFGYYIIPKLLLSFQGRFGYIKMLTKNVPGAAIADFAALVRVRYDIMSVLNNWLGLYAGGGLGFAQIRHAVPLDLDEGQFTDTSLSMGIAPSGFAGLRIGKGDLVTGYVETAFLMTVWNDSDLFTFHMDFTAGVSFSF